MPSMNKTLPTRHVKPNYSDVVVSSLGHWTYFHIKLAVLLFIFSFWYFEIRGQRKYSEKSEKYRFKDYTTD